MKRLKRLQDRRATLIRDMGALLDKAETENRKLSAAETATYDAHLAELGEAAEGDKAATGIFAEIEREERLAAYERTLAPNVENPGGSQNAELSADGTPKKKPIKIEGVSRKPKYFKTAEDAYLSGMFLLSVLGQNEAAKQFCREHGIQFLAAPSSTNNASGGILMTDVLSNVMIDLKEKYGAFRQNAHIAPMLGETLTYPRRLSGVQLYYIGQQQAPTASNAPGLDGVKLVAKDLAGLLRYPQVLAEGAVIDYADFVAKEFAYAFAKAEDEAGFIGDGTSAYGGMQGIAFKIALAAHAGSVVTAAATHDSFEELDMTDFVNVVGKLPEYAKPNAKWYISPTGHAASMLRLLMGLGGNSVIDATGKVQEYFLGFPVVKVHPLNSTLGTDASKIKCLLGDLDLAVTLGDRRQYAIKSNDSVFFTTQEIAVLGTQRFDINVHDIGDATTPGPVVALKTAA